MNALILTIEIAKAHLKKFNKLVTNKADILSNIELKETNIITLEFFNPNYYNSFIFETVNTSILPSILMY